MFLLLISKFSDEGAYSEIQSQCGIGPFLLLLALIFLIYGLSRYKLRLEK
jgi:hypothetical protein